MANINSINFKDIPIRHSIYFSLLIEFLRHFEAHMPRYILPLRLFISLNTYSVELEDVGFFAGCSSQYEPVLDGVKTTSLSLLSNLRVLNPEFSIAAKVCSELLKICRSSRISIILILLKY